MSKSIKTAVVGPKIYSIVVTSKRGAILHLGVYYSLDEAYEAAKKDLYAFALHRPNDSVEIEFWTTMSPDIAVNSLLNGPIGKFPATIPSPVREKTVSEQIRDAKRQKNVIMKKILLKKDLGLLREAKTILSKAEITFLESKLLIEK